MEVVEEKHPKGIIVIDEIFCKGCERCVGKCPRGLLSISNQMNNRGYYPVVFSDSEKVCSGCALCAIVCPDVGAIVVFKERKTQ